MDTLNQDFGNGASVAVNGHGFDCRHLSEGQGRQGLLGTVCPRLAPFWGVYLGKPDFGLFLTGRTRVPRPLFLRPWLNKVQG